MRVRFEATGCEWSFMRASNATPCVVRRIPVRILSRRLLFLSFSLPFSVDSDITDGPISSLSEKGRDKGPREREEAREKERDGRPCPKAFLFISFDSWNKLVRTGPHGVRAMFQLETRGRKREGREGREREKERGAFSEQALKGSSSL